MIRRACSTLDPSVRDVPAAILPGVPDSAWRLVSLPPLPREKVTGLLSGLPVDVVLPASRARKDVFAALSDADLVLGDWSPDGIGLDADALGAAPHLAFVQQPSVGVQAHDLDALAAAGVPLANVAGFNAVAVAEWVLGSVFSLARWLPWSQDEVRAGRWPVQDEILGRGATEVAGRRVGLVGFGPIGQALAARFAALGCPVSYWTRRRRDPANEHGATYRELDRLLSSSDVLVNVIALGPQTRGLLDGGRLALLPDGAFLICASRGGIVDEEATAAALASGRLAGAAFDVFAAEPLPADSPLRASDRVLLTPHVAGTTRQSMARLMAGIVANLARAVSGEPVRDVVNGVGPTVRRRR